MHPGGAAGWPHTRWMSWSGAPEFHRTTEAAPPELAPAQRR